MQDAGTSGTGEDLQFNFTAPGDEEDIDVYRIIAVKKAIAENFTCLLYTSPSPRDRTRYRMPSSA